MTAVLVLLNGPPASGKSTLARRWCERHRAELPLALDLDVLRDMLGGWRSAPLAAGLATRSMAIAAIGVHLRSGRDVLVPQFVERPSFVEELAAAAAAAGAAFLECALVVDPDLALRRHRERSDRARADGRPGPEGAPADPLRAVHERFAAFLLNRRNVVPLDPEDPEVLLRLDERVAEARSGTGAASPPR